jgi:glutamate synthase domain-containing protein 2
MKLTKHIGSLFIVGDNTSEIKINTPITITEFVEQREPAPHYQAVVSSEDLDSLIEQLLAARSHLQKVSIC